MAAEITTGRGVYRLLAVGPLEYTEADVLLTLAMERADGIERMLAKCRITRSLLQRLDPTEVIVEQLKGWIGGEFETIREASLKSIRSERRLHEIVFDQANRGPF
ncbi:MAG: hypothetical protein JO166_21720 [Deltaproteobacteria bacterium]|nr:hypothetical protein [Deltaproteobacteria bacterium]